MEDASQALGSKHGGRHLGTAGSVGAFSLATSKIVTTGAGGMVVSSDALLFNGVLQLKDHGRTERQAYAAVADHYPVVGYNFKFTDLQAALGLAQWGKLDRHIQRVRAIYRLYMEQLTDGVSFLPLNLQEQVPWRMDIILPDAGDSQRLRDTLVPRGIETQLFFKPLHMQPTYVQRGDFADAEWLSARGLYLPSSNFLSDEQVVYVCEQVKAA